MSSETNFS